MRYNFSVIIPYRDKYELLCKAVESIPDRDDIQIIIVDNSDTVLETNLIPTKKNAGLKYLTSDPLKGAGHARNVGLAYVEGIYILFLDADDYFTPTAFDSFDKYLDTDFDIVFFDVDSVRLSDGFRSNRHENIHQYIESFIKDGNEDFLRYRFVNPFAKMIRRDFVKNNNFLFEEVRVANDVMFSVKTGHYAKKIIASQDVVYMITDGGSGSSLTRIRSAENMFARYQVSVRRYQFVSEMGHKEMCPRLSGFLKYALLHFGFKELFRYWEYARKNHVGLF